MVKVASEAMVVEHGTPARFLRQALALLSRKQREIIEMLKFEGFRWRRFPARRASRSHRSK